MTTPYLFFCLMTQENDGVISLTFHRRKFEYAIEQEAIEMKQAAQRLSAENFKLSEDLSDELKRKNVLHEIKRHTGGDATSVKGLGVLTHQQFCDCSKLAYIVSFLNLRILVATL